MKEQFQMLSDPRFNLLYGVTQRFSEGPDPQRIRLNREGYTLLEGVAKKTRVYPLMPLSTHPSPSKGDSFSPIFGEIVDVNARSIFVEACEPDEELLAKAREAAANKVDLRQRPERGQELVPVLKALGLNTKSLSQPCDTLIINGLNPDPGVTWAEPMLYAHQDTFRAGLEILRRLSPAKRFILAVPEGMRLKEIEGVELARVAAWYPSSVNQLVVRSVMDEEQPKGVGIVGLHNLWSLGRVVQTGLPLVETVVTLGSLTHSGNYIVKEGSTIGELLEFASIPLESGDTLVRGGPLRGESLDKLDRSLTKGSTGVFVVEAGTVPRMEGHSPCIGCGACVLICPARLNPGQISRNSEFALHERNRGEYIFSCLECGLCGYVCIARRPVLQYIRLSKHKLEEADAAARLVELKPQDRTGGA